MWLWAGRISVRASWCQHGDEVAIVPLGTYSAASCRSSQRRGLPSDLRSGRRDKRRRRPRLSPLPDASPPKLRNVSLRRSIRFVMRAGAPRASGSGPRLESRPKTSLRSSAMSSRSRGPQSSVVSAETSAVRGPPVPARCPRQASPGRNARQWKDITCPARRIPGASALSNGNGLPRIRPERQL